ncbi:hypothetical protein EG68_04138 [Paragonimus skrjabini miyazakii]|uniref:DNA-directed DNA polymerase n=1 Tax=Paragonimus skrjabini miyazakii TaxID=59628 RepID=A0A8S9YTT7_9TREM|nr:hypothetical protein EG68_04138 [Paragonimus skrjabini miyazakii]
MEILVGHGVRIAQDGLVVPASVFNHYFDSGITSIFPWQADCLKIPGVLAGRRNLVYSAPTSAGKTLIAEVLILKHVLETSTKALIILPFVSVSREKMCYLQKLFTGLSIRVGGFMGGQSPPGGLSAVNVAVCTIEKANSLVNRLVEEDRLEELGLVVVDELHLIGDSHRGYLLELLLTKFLLHSRRLQQHVTESTSSQVNEPASCPVVDRVSNRIQIVGMSATLPNLDVLGKWLNAAVFVTDYRPVPLTELVFTRDSKSSTSHAYEVTRVESSAKHDLRSAWDLTTERLHPVNSPLLDSQLKAEARLTAVDEDGVFGLCLDTLLSGHGVLVFCPTKQWCEQLADTMAKEVCNFFTGLYCSVLPIVLCLVCASIFHLTQAHFAALERTEKLCRNQEPAGNSEEAIQPELIGPRFAAQLDRAGLINCVERLRRCPAGLDSGLARCLGYSVAFHHAGLTVEEREIVENGFRAGVIRILVATSTLSSGVNLPARRVIIRTPLFHGRILDYLCYKQMAGRAGRKGLDTSGQSILLCKPRDLPRVRQLISAGMPPVRSCLIDSHGGASSESSLKRALLEVIANGFIETVTDARLYLSSTLMAVIMLSTNDQLALPSQSCSTRRRSLRLSQPGLQPCRELCGSSTTPLELPSLTEQFISFINRILNTCLSQLCDHDLILIDRSTCVHTGCLDCNIPVDQNERDLAKGDILPGCTRLHPTAFGRAVLSSSLGPAHGLVVFEELDKARRAIALDTDLHFVYLLTPVYLDVGAALDWYRYLEQYQALSAADRRVADLIGVEERFITRCVSGASASGTRYGTSTCLADRVALHRRFYMALALYRLVCEDGLSTVARNFGINRGLLQSLQQQAATYAGMVTVFCNRLGWVHLERLLANYQSRLFYGVSEELVDLLRLLPLVNAQRARALYSGGYTTVSSVASAKPRDLARFLQRAVQFQKGESCTLEQLHRRTIMLDDGCYVNEEEAAPLIVQKAQQLLRDDLTVVYGSNFVIEPGNHDVISTSLTNVMNERTNDDSYQAPVHVPKLEDKDSICLPQETQCIECHEVASVQETSPVLLSLRCEPSEVNSPPVRAKRYKRSSTDLCGASPTPSIDRDRPVFKSPSVLDNSPYVSQALASSQSVVSQNSPTNPVTVSQTEDTFVLTTQLAAIVDSADLVSTDIPHQTAVDCTQEYHTETADSAFTPLSTYDYDMNDTLTFSMLDTALDSTHSKENLEAMQHGVGRSRSSKDRTSLVSPAIGTPQCTTVNRISSATSPGYSTSARTSDVISSESQKNFNAFSPNNRCSEESEMTTDSQSTVPTKCLLGPDFPDDCLFTIVDVTKTEDLWRTFICDINMWIDGFKECSTRLSSLAVQPCWIVSNLDEKLGECSIVWRSGPAGSRAVGGGSNQNCQSIRLAGLSISSALLRPRTVFWIDLTLSHMFLCGVRKLLDRISQANLTLVVWDAKWFYRLANDVFHLNVFVPVLDPGTLGWLRDPDRGRTLLSADVIQLNPQMRELVEQLKVANLSPEPPTQFSDWTQLLRPDGEQPDGLCPPTRTMTSRLSQLSDHISLAAIQCYFLAQWTNPDLFCMADIPKALLKLEFPCQALLSRLESTGFVLDISCLLECRDVLEYHAQVLERVAHRLSGQPFQLSSPIEISKVLFSWLRLPQLTDSSDRAVAKRRNQVALLTGRRPHSCRNSYPRATNALLARLCGLHPLPAITIEWRRIHGLLEKTFSGLVTACERVNDRPRDTKSDTVDQDVAVHRISPTYDVHTATGRIISCMPNIQAVPNDIVIDYSNIITHRIPSLSQYGPRTPLDSVSKPQPTNEPWPEPIAAAVTDLPKEPVILRPRKAFRANTNCVLISADYCQLELRLLAHFSQDSCLINLLSVDNSSSNCSDLPPPPALDAFRKLAAYWLHLPSTEEVSATQRQQAKQLCYALVYGMGAQGLAAQLDISELEAQRLADSFLRAYPGVQQFISCTIQSAHRVGRVTTLNGRVRLLSALDNETMSAPESALGLPLVRGRSQQSRQHYSVAKAERQAVNTIIQGSAAEISKAAMLAVDTKLASVGQLENCRLVLHEHDELVYEVNPASAAPELGALIRHTMARVSQDWNLSVPLPVKLRVGLNWSEMEEVPWS